MPAALATAANRRKAALGAALLAMVGMQTIRPLRAEGIVGSEKKISRDPGVASWTGDLSARNDARALLARRPKDKARPDARTLGLGHSCQTTADCIGRAQICLKEADANGKELKTGLCALPCTAIDAGMTNPATGPVEPTEENVKEAKKPPPPRCPKKYQCRSAGSGVPIDLCIKE